MQQDWGTEREDVDLGTLERGRRCQPTAESERRVSNPELKGVCEWTTVKDGVEVCSGFLEKALGFLAWLYELEGTWFMGRLAKCEDKVEETQCILQPLSLVWVSSNLPVNVLLSSLWMVGGLGFISTFVVINNLEFQVPSENVDVSSVTQQNGALTFPGYDHPITCPGQSHSGLSVPLSGHCREEWFSNLAGHQGLQEAC